MSEDVVHNSQPSIASSDIDTHTAIAHLFYLDNTLRDPYGPFALTPHIITPDTSRIFWSALDLNNLHAAADNDNPIYERRINPVTQRFGLFDRTRLFARDRTTNAIVLHNVLRQVDHDNHDAVNNNNIHNPQRIMPVPSTFPNTQ